MLAGFTYHWLLLVAKRLKMPICIKENLRYSVSMHIISKAELKPEAETVTWSSSKYEYKLKD